MATASPHPPTEDAPQVDKSGQRVRGMFGEIAGRYDLMNHLLSLNLDRYWRWRAVRRAWPVGNSPVLDLCTGTGDLALAYAKADREALVVGADFCRPMLAIGRRKAARRGHDHDIVFVEADAQQLPFPSDSFQIVSVAFGLRNVADTDRGLSEMARVCQPSGKVVVLEFSTPSWEPFRSLYLFYFRHVLPRLGQFLSRNRFDAYSYLPQSVGQFSSGRQLAERMRGVGLQDVQFTPLTLGVATMYVGTKP